MYRMCTINKLHLSSDVHDALPMKIAKQRDTHHPCSPTDNRVEISAGFAERNLRFPADALPQSIETRDFHFIYMHTYETDLY